MTAYNSLYLEVLGRRKKTHMVGFAMHTLYNAVRTQISLKHTHTPLDTVST